MFKSFHTCRNINISNLLRLIEIETTPNNFRVGNEIADDLNIRIPGALHLPGTRLESLVEKLIGDL